MSLKMTYFTLVFENSIYSLIVLNKVRWDTLKNSASVKKIKLH